MQRTKTENITSVLGVFLRANGLETPLAEYRLVKAWPQAVTECMGEAIGQRISQVTTDLQIRQQTLHVCLQSPALRQQIRMYAPTLVASLNKHAGMTLITDIALH